MSHDLIWRLDPAHTAVEFAVRHLMIATVRGRFTQFRGEARLDPADPTGAELRVTIDAASITTGNADRDAHLRSPDFFDVERFPTLTFQSRRVERVRDGRFRLVGDLTIRDVTREVALEVRPEGQGRDPWGTERLGYRAETQINRPDFGLTWNQALEAGGVLVSDEVRITLDVELTAESTVQAAA
jgi:polyisoprenoid-binding protein YceI